jgi:uncharacterized protein with HEPN domain
MTRRTRLRLQDIAENIEYIEDLLASTPFVELQQDRVASAALERFLELVSEAARHLPPDLTSRFPQVPWRKIADLGNVLRHAYQHTDPAILWDISQTHLPELKAALADMIQNLGEDAQ